MKNVVEVLEQKVREYQRVYRQVEALKIVAPLLREDGDVVTEQESVAPEHRIL